MGDTDSLVVYLLLFYHYNLSLLAKHSGKMVAHCAEVLASLSTITHPYENTRLVSRWKRHVLL